LGLARKRCWLAAHLGEPLGATAAFEGDGVGILAPGLFPGLGLGRRLGTRDSVSLATGLRMPLRPGSGIWLTGVMVTLPLRRGSVDRPTGTWPVVEMRP